MSGLDKIDELFKNLSGEIMSETEFSLSPDQWRLVDTMVDMRRSWRWRIAAHLVGNPVRGEVRRKDTIVFADTASGECP